MVFKLALYYGHKTLFLVWFNKKSQRRIIMQILYPHLKLGVNWCCLPYCCRQAEDVAFVITILN